MKIATGDIVDDDRSEQINTRDTETGVTVMYRLYINTENYR
jgi:hypothetical protein